MPPHLPSPHLPSMSPFFASPPHLPSPHLPSPHLPSIRALCVFISVASMEPSLLASRVVNLLSSPLCAAVNSACDTLPSLLLSISMPHLPSPALAACSPPSM